MCWEMTVKHSHCDKRISPKELAHPPPPSPSLPPTTPSFQSVQSLRIRRFLLTQHGCTFWCMKVDIEGISLFVSGVIMPTFDSVLSYWRKCDTYFYKLKSRLLFWRKNVQVRPLVFVQSPLNQIAKWSLSSWPTAPDWNKNCFTFCSQMSVLTKLRAKSPTRNNEDWGEHFLLLLCWSSWHKMCHLYIVHFSLLHKKINDRMQDSNPIYPLNETAAKTRFLTIEIFLLFLLSPPQQCSQHMQISVYWVTVQRLFIERISSSY